MLRSVFSAACHLVIYICLIRACNGILLAQPVTVTNLAGRAISGELIEFSEKNIQLQVASGSKMTLPLKIFSASEISRLRKIAGIPEPPSPAVAKIQRDLANDLSRIDARESAGTLTAEEAAQRRAEARAWAERKLRKLAADADNARQSSNAECGVRSANGSNAEGGRRSFPSGIPKEVPLMDQ